MSYDNIISFFNLYVKNLSDNYFEMDVICEKVRCEVAVIWKQTWKQSLYFKKIFFLFFLFQYRKNFNDWRFGWIDPNQTVDSDLLPYILPFIPKTTITHVTF